MATPRGSQTSTYHILRFLVLGLARAAPLHLLEGAGDGEAKPDDDPSKWAYLGTAVALVLLGGAFAGLTIAYVGALATRGIHG
jgi:metal transporter CNNM